MATVDFKDHFSTVSDAYAQARPEYPDALFDTLAAHVPAGAHVWEPGCGSGQATRGLAERFAHVYATDPSAQQIARHWAAPHDPGVPAEAAVAREVGEPVPDPARGHAGTPAFGHARAPRLDALRGHLADAAADAPAARVTVAVEPAERTALSDGSVQLIAVAQALHWFDHAAFFAECERVLAPGGALAAWGYGDFEPPAEIEVAAAAFSARILPYWPPERAWVDARYDPLAWPFAAVPAPALWLQARWTLPHFLQYLASMSAAARCAAATGVDPVAAHAPALAAAWGEPSTMRTIRWPLFLHMRRKAGR